jgi:uncharacterized protein
MPLLVLAVVLSLVGCASYPERTRAAFNKFEQGDLERALHDYQEPKTTGSEFLHYAESGMVALAAGKWDAALDSFTKAVEYNAELERAALISPESLGEETLSWVLNDTLKEYRGEGYERLMCHAALAMTYLAQGQFESAQVEVRLANELLASEEALYEKQYKAGGLAHFLSAVAYEMTKDDDEAYIDYKAMLAKEVGGQLAGHAALRLARKLHRDDDLEELERRFGEGAEVPAGSASIVVIGGVGVGPYKRAVTLPVPLEEGIFQWSVPTHQTRPQQVSELELSVRGADKAVRTEVVENVDEVASENLSDRIAWMATKSAVRATLKYALTKELGDKHGAAGAVLGILFTVFTEHADLRSWQTLPSSWQAARVFLPAGKHALVLRALGGEAAELGTFELDAGETMFVFARTIGPRLFAHPIGGKRVETAVSEGVTTP